MPTRLSCSRPAASRSGAPTKRCCAATDGTRRSGATSSSKRASRRHDGHTRCGIRRPSRRATLWLAVAGLLEAAGPIFGKQFIDAYLLPRALDWTTMTLLVAGYLVTGWLATAIRYFQLVG